MTAHSKPGRLTVWAGQVRARFLLLSVLLVLIGGGAAAYDGVLDIAAVALCALGVTLAHAAVNLFNELSDHATRIDEHTRRTPFSGGTGTLQAGWLTRRQVTAAAWLTLLGALAVGLYLSLTGSPWLWLFIVPGGLASVFYTTHLARWMLGELAAGLALGSLVVAGTYFAQAGTLTWPVVVASVPPGVLTALLLLLNEFPDVEADRAGGRRHLVIVLGRHGAAVLYAVALAAAYAVVVAGAALGWLPPATLLALLTLPLAVKAGRIALGHGGDHEAMLPALGANVGVVLGTDLLLAVGYFLHAGLA